MIGEIRDLLVSARRRVASQVNTGLLSTFWNVGRIIVGHEQENRNRADYGKQTLRLLSKEWSLRELKRQISTSLYERLLLSAGRKNREKVPAFAEKGIEISSPSVIIRDPYVFEFLGLPENRPVLESNLEKALTLQMERFLLELGLVFMFVGTQQRITPNNIHYYVDMVFCNKILKVCVLIELKTTKLMQEAVGQLNMYLNYYAKEVYDEYDNPSIGIILCTDRDNVAAEYAPGGLSNNIYASRHVQYIPDKNELQSQVEAVLSEWNYEGEDVRTSLKIIRSPDMPPALSSFRTAVCLRCCLLVDNPF